ncbi:MAG: 1-(5-phosphoribosyl)-5-[(5-phosphoribosylamino)methylideneamino]imidazole-4-carboxamide isomerase [Anaerolineae bacterium]
MGEFTVYPAIDLRHGRVVRLAQGDPNRETAYDDDPLHVAERWQAAGASWVHVVNLDGAFGEASSENSRALEAVLTTSLSVQFGGGIRTISDMAQVLDLGGARVVVGTAAVENPSLLAEALARFGADRVAVGIDARDDVVQIRGWQAAAPITAAALARRWADLGGRWMIFTDVSRDGMGSGVNVAATASLARETGLQVIASGGVRSLDDVRRVHDAGLDGVIIGRALYEGHLELVDALDVARKSGA